MAKGMGINIGVQVDKKVSNKNITDFLNETNKNNLLKVGMDVDMTKLTNLAGKIKETLKFDVQIDDNGVVNVTRTILNEYGQIYKIKEQITEQDGVQVQSIKLVKDMVKEQEESYGKLLKLTKEKGKLDKDLQSAEGMRVESLKAQRKEVVDQIRAQEKYIKNHKLSNEELRQQVENQETLNELALKEDKQSKNYKIVIESLQNEYKYKKQLINASKEEAEILKDKIALEQKNRRNANSSLSRNDGALRTDELEALVKRTKELGEAELNATKKQKERITTYDRLLELTKEKGKLEKDSLKANESELEVIQKRQDEIEREIKQKERLINRKGLEDEERSAKITEQQLKNELEINRLRAKSGDNERASHYDSLIKSIEKEYKLRKDLINASEVEVDLIKEKIENEENARNSIRNSLKDKGLENQQLEETVSLLTQQQEKELQVAKAKKEQAEQLKTQKQMYDEVFKLENDIAKLTKKSTSVGSEQQGMIYTQILEKEIELEQRKKQIKDSGLISEEKENQLLVIRKANQEEILRLEAQLLDKAEEQNEAKEKYLQLEKMRMTSSISGIMDEKNTGYYDVQKLDELIKRMQKLEEMDFKEAKHEVALLKQEIKEMASETNAKRIKATREEMDKMKYSLSDLAKYVTAGMIISRLWDMMRQGTQDVISLNSAVTTLNLTMSQLSNNQIGQLTQSSQQMARDLKASVNDVLLSVKTVANANETIDSIINKSKSAVVLSNLTGLDTSVTVDAVQGAIFAFDDLAEATEEDAMRVADAMVGISKSLGMDFSEGIQGMTTSLSTLGSFANQVGLNIEETLGTVAGIAESTRLSFDEVATAMRNIMARTMRISDVDNGIGETEMLKAEKALDSVGVAIRKSDGEMRDFMGILTDLSGKWENLNGQQQQYLADALG